MNGDNSEISNIVTSIKFNCEHNPQIKLNQLEQLLCGRNLKDLDEYYEMRYYAGCSAMYNEEYCEVRDIGKELLNVSHVSKSKTAELYGHNLCGIAEFNSGYLSECLYHYLQGYKKSKELKSTRMTIVFLMNLCWVHAQKKEYAEFDTLMIKCLQILDNYSNPRMTFKALVLQAKRYLDDFKISTGEAILFKVREYTLYTENNIDLFYYHLTLSLLHRLKKNRDQSFAHLNLAEQKISDLKMKRLRILIDEAYYHYYISMENYEYAMSHLEDMRKLSDSLENPYYIKRNLYHYGNYYECINQHATACSYYRKYSEYKENQITDSQFTSIMLENCNLLNQLSDLEDKVQSCEILDRKWQQLISHLKRTIPELMKLCKYEAVLNEIAEALSIRVELHNLILIVFDWNRQQYEIKYQQNPSASYSHDKVKAWCMKFRNTLEPDNFVLETGNGKCKKWLIPLESEGNNYPMVIITYDGQLDESIYDLISHIITSGLQSGSMFSNAELNDLIDSKHAKNTFNNDFQCKCALSKRELQVIESTSQGNTNQVIAEQLGISESTVKNHLNRIFKKLNLNNRYELISYYLEQRIPEQFIR